MKDLSKMKISEAMPLLKTIAETYDLRLNRAKEFKMARAIFVNIYYNE